MSIENIIERISSDTEEKKRKILEESGRKCREILALYEKEARKTKDEMLDLGNKKIKEEHDRKILLLNLEIKKEQLSEKRKLLNEVYLELLKKLNDTSPANLVKIVSEKLKANVLSCDEILISAKYKNNLSTLKDINGVGLKFVDIDGIFVIKKDTSQVTFSFEELISELKEKTEKKTSEILFND